MTHVRHIVDGRSAAVPKDFAGNHRDEGHLRKGGGQQSYLGAGEAVGDLDGRFVEMLSILAQNVGGLDPLHVVRSCFLFSHSSGAREMKCDGEGVFGKE